MHERLKSLVASKNTLEELIELRAQARLLWQEYEIQKLDHPSWLNNAIILLDKEISSRVFEERSRRLSDARARRNSLRTTEEKRADLDREILELEESIK